MNKDNFNMVLTKEQKQAFKSAAAKRGQGMSSEVRRLMCEYIEKYK